MKKVIFGFFVLTLLFASSCSKNNSSNPGGSWSFKGTTYNTTTCQNVVGTLTASNVTTSNTSTFGTLYVAFPNATLPTTGGTYTVVNWNGNSPTGNQVAINLTTAGGTTIYSSTGGNGSNQTVSVTVNNGKVSVSGSGIELDNQSTASDSSALTLNITQLQ